ncbi:type 4a pilus biogenesis protein PilO [Patescibacteria group bacterium]|nr:type 4a pilus biogenesis protein PilO [Patescibacteria group bacterium]
MKGSTKRALSILFSVFFLIASFIVYTNLIQPEMGTASELQAEVASKNNAYQSQKNAVAQVSKLIGQFQNATALQESLSLGMPIGPGITQALNQWYAISGNSQANVQSLDIKLNNSLSPAAQPLTKRMGTVVVNLGVVGTYDSIKQFLNSLESNARVINVSSLDFKPVGQATGSSPLYSLELTVNTFYQEN